MKRKVLVTGAGGRVGRAFVAYVGDRYDLRLVDRNPESLAYAAGHETRVANMADLAACQEVCAGVDSVLNLSADPSTKADFYESLLDNNIKSAYNLFRAAKDQGCRRVIFASSIQVIEGYPLDFQAKPDSPIKPMNMYAAGKAFGEAMAHYFAYAEGLSSIAVRIGAFEGNREWDGVQPDGRTLSAFVGKRDLSHLFERCIEVEDLPFAILQAVSDNRFKRMDITTTRQLVGYRPLEDAFARFETGIHDTERWLREYDRGQGGNP
jgi:nucleoside-diphosphate-sugar epimerase